MNLWAIFLTGLTSGGLSCVVMQGGLLAGIIANQKEREIEKPSEETQAKSFDQLDWLPVTLFLISKLIAHTLLGFLLGWFGSQFQLNLALQLTFQGLAALFMLATAANLLELHPIFRYVVFQPPKFLLKLVRNSTKGRALFTPALFGFLSIFIPCGVTQAMEVLAISSGSPLLGALIMFSFVLGTSPVFALLGVATAKLSEAYHQRFLKFAAAMILLLALSSLNGILVVLDAPLTFQKTQDAVVYFFSEERVQDNTAKLGARNQTGVQKVMIQVKTNGYSPNRIKVEAGRPVELTLETNNTYSCASSFLLKAFDVRLQLKPTDSQTVTFTPTKKGKYPFTCSMGMYTGVLEVI